MLFLHGFSRRDITLVFLDDEAVSVFDVFDKQLPLPSYINKSLILYCILRKLVI